MGFRSFSPAFHLPSMHGGIECNKIGYGARIASHFQSFSEGKLAVAATTRIKAQNEFNIRVIQKVPLRKAPQRGT